MQRKSSEHFEHQAYTPPKGVRLVFSSFIRRIFVRRLTLMVSRIRTALNAAIRNATAHYNRGREFSRKRTLTRETVIRLLISAEGGSLAKILHDAGIQATASALKSRPKCSAQFSPTSIPLAPTMSSFVVIVESVVVNGDTCTGYRINKWLLCGGQTVRKFRSLSRSKTFTKDHHLLIILPYIWRFS